MPISGTGRISTKVVLTVCEDELDWLLLEEELDWLLLEEELEDPNEELPTLAPPPIIPMLISGTKGISLVLATISPIPVLVPPIKALTVCEDELDWLLLEEELDWLLLEEELEDPNEELPTLATPPIPMLISGTKGIS